MKIDNDQLLCTRYPKIFSERNGEPRAIGRPFGFSCRDGWFDLINSLCGELQKISDRTGSQVVAIQVKEKFGGLRFYVKGETSEHEGAIAAAEQASLYTCELCGQPGEVKVASGYVQCRCPDHMPMGALTMKEQQDALRESRDERA